MDSPSTPRAGQGPRSRSSRLLRSAIKIGLALVFLACVFGIMLTGPIIVAPPLVDTGAEADPERLRASVERLCSEFHPRDYRHPENLTRASDWIAEELRNSGLHVEFQDYSLQEGDFRNVVGISPGTDPDAAAIVIGAHYDAYGGFPGADDNASGVAVLLELARSLPQPQVRATRYFAAFSTEEPPFFGTGDMGSARFAESLLAEGVAVELMVALDMVGVYSDEPASQELPLPGLGVLYPRRGNFVAVIGDLGSGEAIGRVKSAILASEKLPVYSFRAPAMIDLVHLSDHLPFRERGMPAVQVTDTSFMRVSTYHTRNDTPEALDYRKMALLTEALQGVLWDPQFR
jgi:hypothetical protein